MNSETKEVVRASQYKDYIAVDVVDQTGKIISTPFYIKEGQTIEAHWPRPVNEDPPGKQRIHYDDFNDVFLFMMKDGMLFSKWANGGLNSVYDPVNIDDLDTWEFAKARKIRKATGKYE